MEIRSAANLPERVRIGFPAKGRTRTSMQKECDINFIMAKYQKTGAINHFSRHSPRYGFADSVTFHEALNVVTEGDRMFADLPSELRQRFEEPGQFLDFVQDEKNADEMVELGLRKPSAPQEQILPPATPAPATPAPDVPAASGEEGGPTE